MEAFNLYAKPGYKMKLLARIKWWFRRRKFIRQRARWGFSEYDTWDFQSFHAHIVSEMMAYWADHMHSHHPEMTEEEWQTTLRKISECFAFWNKELPNPAYQAYKKATKRIKNKDGSITVSVPDEEFEAWHKEEWANYELKRQKLKEGFDLLYEYYPHLWD